MTTTTPGGASIPLEHTWGAVSGRNLDDAVALGYRGQAGVGFRPEAGDSWVIQFTGDQGTSRLYVGGWFTGLWRAPSGRTFVTHAPGKIHQADDVAGGAVVERARRPGHDGRVWGLDDAHVYAWGLRGGRSFLLRFDGDRWADMPAPGPERIVAMGGSREDHLVAVGEAGLLARWDGSRWARARGGHGAARRRARRRDGRGLGRRRPRGSVLQGSPYGFSLVTRGSARSAGSRAGATRSGSRPSVRTDSASCAEPRWTRSSPTSRACTSCRTSRALLFSSTADVGHTADGAAFVAQGVDALERITAPFAPMWVRGACRLPRSCPVAWRSARARTSPC
ncbi:MAG: hypothetical protein SangKO_044320 [Sandaracinaceae bacterium]